MKKANRIAQASTGRVQFVFFFKKNDYRDYFLMIYM